MMPVEIQTPVGRIVWGNPTKPQTKKHQDGQNKGQPVLKDGQPVQQWAFGIAFPKETTVRAQNIGNPNIEEIVASTAFERTVWPAMAQEAATGYPQGIPPRFAWKYQDGDGIDSHGKPFSDREGYAGHIILTVSTEAFAPPIYKLQNGAYVQLQPDQIKCGDYVTAALNIKVNVATGTNTPSLYINPIAIEHVGYGTEIQSINAVDPNAVFGGRQHALPAGASLTPLAPVAPVGMPGTAPQPPPPPAPGAMPGMTAPPAMMAPPAPVPPPPPLTPPAPARPVDPSHIAPDGRGGELWWNGAAWVPGASAPPPPPPAHDFVANAGMPGMPGPR